MKVRQILLRLASGVQRARDPDLAHNQAGCGRQSNSANRNNCKEFEHREATIPSRARPTLHNPPHVLQSFEVVPVVLFEPTRTDPSIPVSRTQRIGGWPPELIRMERLASVVAVLLASPAVLSVLIAPLWVK